ncbi:hypothetical protein CHS0354_008241 [Potamilus streckersoni]|uniref:Uncharacterized protein n=1 Tax=Potamilus streckersoni TaxID=2493646 RepID=A0AAE0T6L2_9BIVA|nr:hypothetical protein CHS0354_008241 [Potamilus streckersoni]
MTYHGAVVADLATGYFQISNMIFKQVSPTFDITPYDQEFSILEVEAVIMASNTLTLASNRISTMFFSITLGT